MDTQVSQKKRVIWVMVAMAAVISAAPGCSRKTQRVYKIAHGTENVDGSSWESPQWQRPYNIKQPSRESLHAQDSANSVQVSHNERRGFYQGGQQGDTPRGLGGTRQRDYTAGGGRNYNANNSRNNTTYDSRNNTVNGSRNHAANNNRNYSADNSEYHIGSADVLEIKIFQLIELDRQADLMVTVDRNGYIYLPLLNHVAAAGRTVKDVRAEIVESLGREFIRDPKVDVNVKVYNSKKVMVLGHVGEPGPLALESDKSTLLDVIARSGGINAEAGPDIEILRGAYNSSGLLSPGILMNQQGYRSERVLISQLFAEGGPDHVNPIIYPGDVVKVRPSDEGYVYLSGEVEKPGAKTFRRPLTILQAVTCAGGTTNIAAEGKCKIIRRDGSGVEREIIVDLDDIRQGKEKNLLLAQNDTIIIPVHPVKKVLDDIDQMFKRGVQTGISVTYDGASEMGIPSAGNTMTY